MRRILIEPLESENDNARTKAEGFTALSSRGLKYHRGSIGITVKPALTFYSF